MPPRVNAMPVYDHKRHDANHKMHACMGYSVCVSYVCMYVYVYVYPSICVCDHKRCRQMFVMPCGRQPMCAWCHVAGPMGLCVCLTNVTSAFSVCGSLCNRVCVCVTVYVMMCMCMWAPQSRSSTRLCQAARVIVRAACDRCVSRNRRTVCVRPMQSGGCDVSVCSCVPQSCVIIT